MIIGNTELAIVAIVLSIIVVVISLAISFEFSRRQRNLPAAAQLEGLETVLERKHQERIDLDNALAQRRGEMTRREAVENEVARLEERLAELRAQHAGMDDQRREIAALIRDGEAAAIDLAQKRRDAAEAEREATSARQEAERASLRAATAEALADRLPELEARAQELRAEVAALEAQADEARRLVDAAAEARREREAQERALERLQSMGEERQQALSALGTRAEEAERKLEALRGEIAGRAAELAAVTLEIGKATSERDRLKPDGDGGDEHGADPLADLRAPMAGFMWLKAPSRDGSSEEDALDRLRQHALAKGLRYSERTLKAFHTAMKVNDTSQLAVLAGISGTGKSQLPRLYAEAMGMGFLMVPVQPRWDSPQDLMGFYNYVEQRYRATDLARALWLMDGQGGEAIFGNRMLMVLLDEMNLARVEYYFADFLSRLESRPRPGDEDEAAKHRARIELDVPPEAGRGAVRIYPGHNVLFAGTMNEDESTQTLSDKVLDRANLLRFAPPATFEPLAPATDVASAPPLSFSQWREWRRPQHDRVGETGAIVDRMGAIMGRLGRPFGYRLRGAILAYVANYPGDWRTALGDQVEMRLLPKARGVDVDEGGEAGLRELMDVARGDLDDTALAEAIEDSMKRSHDEGGRFAWRGVARR